MSTEKKFAVGDAVCVYGRLRRSEGFSVPGVVTKIGRTLVTIEYGAEGDITTIEKFKITDQRVNDQYGQRHFMTLERAEMYRRRESVRDTLRTHGVLLSLGHDLTLEQMEALAAVFNTEPPRRESAAISDQGQRDHMQVLWGIPGKHGSNTEGDQ